MLLPAVGVLTRFIGFLGDPAIPFEVAAARSVPELALEAMGALTLPIAALALYYGWSSVTTRMWRLIDEFDEGMEKLKPALERQSAELAELTADLAGLGTTTNDLESRLAAFVARWGRAAKELEPAAAEELRGIEEAANAAERDFADLRKLATEHASEVPIEVGNVRALAAQTVTSMGWVGTSVKLGLVLSRPLHRPVRWLRRHVPDRPIATIVTLNRAFVVGVVVFFPTFPAGPISVLGTWLAGRWFDRIAVRDRRVTLRAVVPAAFLLLATGVVGYGLQPYQPIGVRVTASDGSFAEGQYAILGHTDLTTYLRACETSALLGVRSDSISSSAFRAAAQVPLGPSLRDVITGAPLGFGIRSGCR